uniref:tRNA wybutosine-synthesizing protein 3 homolog n=1 Tax=Astyanax mexicanus TaxID=7994 RepID=A0A8B9L1F9_ASTMX
MEEGNLFKQWKKQCLNKLDLSKKGSIDRDISHVVSLLNNSDYYFTTSSCSGRIILIDGVSDCTDVQKQNCSWLFVTHEKCQKEDVITALEKSSGDAVFKFEPCVLHVQCRQLENAQLLHSVAINSGFRNSGVTVGKKGKTIMAVRSTHCLEVPLSRRGRVLVSEEYIEFIVETANNKMEENLKRIERCVYILLNGVFSLEYIFFTPPYSYFHIFHRFYDCLRAALDPEQVNKSCLTEEQTQKKPVYRRRRKRAERDRPDSDCGLQNQSENEQQDDLDSELTLFN